MELFSNCKSKSNESSLVTLIETEEEENVISEDFGLQESMQQQD